MPVVVAHQWSCGWLSVMMAGPEELARAGAPTAGEFLPAGVTAVSRGEFLAPSVLVRCRGSRRNRGRPPDDPCRPRPSAGGAFVCRTDDRHRLLRDGNKSVL